MTNHELLKNHKAYPLPRLDFGVLDNLYGFPAKNLIIRSKKEFTYEQFQRAKGLLTELNQDYGIATPLLRISSPPTDGRQMVVVQKIQGILLADTVLQGNNFLASINGLCGGLMRYAQDKFENGGEYLLDMQLKQFMWGRRRTDKEDKPYFVDLDPRIGVYNPERPGDKIHFIQALPVDIGEMILSFESKYGKGSISARKDFQIFTSKILQDKNTRNFVANHLPIYSKFT